jgi:predicted porin
VTVYGILDVGFSSVNSRIPQVNSAAPFKTNTAGFGQSAQTTSRLGFRGTESLGGGTDAFFTAEFQLFPTEYNLSGNAQSGLVNRQTFVGLSQKGIGRASIGTQNTPYFNMIAMTDPGQLNNTVGSLINPVGNQANAGISNPAFTTRQNQSLFVQSDRLSGIRIAAMYSANNADRTQSANLTTNATSGGTTNINGWGLSADYLWKKLTVAAAYQSFKNETDNGAGVAATPALTNLPTAAALNSNGTVTTNGTNITDNQAYAAAVYDFGILKAYINWGNRKVTSATNSNVYLERSAQQLGVRGNWTPKIESWATVGNGSTRGFGVGEPTANFTGYQIGTNYIMSKRTNLYGIFGSTQSSNVVSPNATGVRGSGGVNQYALGIRHTF